MLPFELDLLEAHEMMGRRELGAKELALATLEHIDRWNKDINAFITVRDPEAVIADAVESDRRWRMGTAGPLEGSPIALKDNYATKGLRTTAGSRILSDWVPATDATVVERLKAAGAVLVGKLNMHEFANGTYTDNPHYGRTYNPWDKSRTPGGSSGGSGAALAMRMCQGATGSDTGGSIRMPAAACGIVGLKPTYGLVSRAGIVPFSWSLDHAGPMARSVRDVASMLDVIAGYDPADPASSDQPHSYSLADETSCRGIRLGVTPAYFTTALEPSIRDVFTQNLATLESLGASIREVGIPAIEASPAAEMTILFSEAAAFHQQWLTSRIDDYGADVRRSLVSGKLYSGEEYAMAQRVRAVLKRSFSEAFQTMDYLITPTMPIVAPHWDTENISLEDGGGELEAFIKCVIPFNLTGLPAISVPAGLSSEGIPVGLQIIGRAFDEGGLFRVAAAFEAAVGRLTPPVLEGATTR